MKSSDLLNSAKLKELGILDWGYTEEPIPRTLSHYEKWVQEEKHGPLSYLSDHRKHLRRDLKNFYPEFKSALVFLFSYQEAKKWMMENDKHLVAAYTLGFSGEDYHFALRARLLEIAHMLQLNEGEFTTTLDAQPVLERDLAYRAGLGWFGKNSMLIHQKEGSYFIIGSLLLNKTLPIDSPVIDTDHCGQCVACVEACPTQAIDVESRTLIASRCISTFTIEIFKEADPPSGYENARGEVFGCDICQDVCPWNRKPLTRVISELKLLDRFSFLKEWLYLWPQEKLKNYISLESNRGFRKKLQGTPFDRPGKNGWLKNFRF